MLKVMAALEIHAYGIFKNEENARDFNSNVGGVLHLHTIRTALDLERFKYVFFKKGAEGAYLEECCGKGNVVLKDVTPMYAVHGISGAYRERNSIDDLFSTKQKAKDWNRLFYKDTTLLNLEEIEGYALNPFKVVYIRNFGEVNAKNIEEFRGLYFDSCRKHQLNRDKKIRNEKIAHQKKLESDRKKRDQILCLQAL